MNLSGAVNEHLEVASRWSDECIRQLVREIEIKLIEKVEFEPGLSSEERECHVAVFRYLLFQGISLKTSKLSDGWATVAQKIDRAENQNDDEGST